jgi:hypothetical protein
MTFNGLARVMRYVKIDGGITIDINVDDLRRNPSGLVDGHYALGRIRYGEEGDGYLLYVKASLTGDEDEDVKEYRARHAEFPHESTGQQFFNEGQFEAYRSLGHHIGSHLFTEGFARRDTERAFVRWFAQLEERVRQRYPRELDLGAFRRELADIERSLQDSAVAEYLHQIYPELAQPTMPAPTATSAEGARRVFLLCQKQLRFMEDVFVSLSRHEGDKRRMLANLGYLSLFKRWAGTVAFRAAVGPSLRACSTGFQQFCADNLDLTSPAWRIGAARDVTADAWTQARAAADGIGLESGPEAVWLCERRTGPTDRQVASAIVRVTPASRRSLATVLWVETDPDLDRSLREEIRLALHETLVTRDPRLISVQFLP